MLAILSDIHLGNFATGARPVTDAHGLNSRGAMTVRVLRESCRLAVKMGATGMIWNGDVFHTKLPQPQLLAYAVEIAREVRDAGCQLVVNRGNHDMIGDVAGADSLGVLQELAGVVTVPDRMVIGGVDVVLVPYRHPTAERTAAVLIDEALRDAGGGVATNPGEAGTICIAHFGLSDGAAWQSMAHDFVDPIASMELARRYGIRAMVHGHGHAPIDIEPAAPNMAWVGQVGTLCPAGHAEDGIAGRFLLVGDGGPETRPKSWPRAVRAPGAPWFATAWKAEDIAEIATKALICPGPVFLRCVEALREAADAVPYIEHVGVIPEDVPDSPGAGSSDRLGGDGVVDVQAALAEYVETGDFAVGIDRAVVLAAVRKRISGLA